MDTNQNNSASIVTSVARHERELLGKIEVSHQDARDIVDLARSDAQKHLQDEEARLTDETAALRRERDEIRQKGFDATVEAAEERLVSVREEAAQKVEGLAKEVLAMFIPRTSGGN